MLSSFDKMFVRANVLSMFALLAHASYCGTEGWENICPGRRTHSPARNIWNAPLAKGLSAFDVEWRDGATGTVSMVKMRRGPAIEIAKRNAVGYVVVRPKSPFGAPPGTRLRAYAGSESRDADCGYSYGFLVMHGGKERLSHFSKFDRFGRGGPKQTLMALHCLRGGEYGIRPPRAGKVVNMKSGKTVYATGGTFKVRMTAGETRWYRLR